MARMRYNSVRFKDDEDRAIQRHEVRDREAVWQRKAQAYNDRAMARVEDIYNAFYSGIDPRRRQESADAGMIREDQTAMANLSPRPIHRQFPGVSYYDNPYIDATVQGYYEDDYAGLPQE